LNATLLTSSGSISLISNSFTTNLRKTYNSFAMRIRNIIFALSIWCGTIKKAASQRHPKLSPQPANRRDDHRQFLKQLFRCTPIVTMDNDQTLFIKFEMKAADYAVFRMQNYSEQHEVSSLKETRTIMNSDFFS